MAIVTGHARQVHNMRAADFAQLDAFLVVARELNFRRAAAQLHLSPSLLSRLIRRLEERVDARLLHRTTRSVALTEAGRILAEEAAPAFASLRQALDDAGRNEREPTGGVRINLPQLAAQMVFAPALGRFAAAYPRVRLDLIVDDALRDVVAQGCDAGVRLGPAVQQDMVAVRISTDLRVALVGSPAYLRGRPVPQRPADLSDHVRLSYRWSATGARFVWILGAYDMRAEIPADDRFTFNDVDVLVRAALAGAGLALVLEARVADHLADGSLERVMEGWWPVLPPFFLYYPSGRHTAPALQAVARFFRATP